ncbi:8-oxo-dGTP diphosphatase MutT [Thermodesulfobacteriota bacterium]
MKPHYNVAAGIIRKDGLILIARRPKGRHLAGLWEFPGGKQEDGESLENCLEREMREELGLSVKADKSVMRVDYEYAKKTISLYFFECYVLGGEPEVMESQDVKWVNPMDLSEFNFPPPDMKLVDFLSSLPASGC